MVSYICVHKVYKEKTRRYDMIADILIIIELLAIFFMITALVYVMYSLYEYKAYGIKVIAKDTRE